MALLAYKTDDWAGYVEGEDERGKDSQGIHHLAFWGDDLEETEKKIEKAGGKYFQDRPTEKFPDTFYEMKFRDPHGVILDCTHLGWDGAIKDVVSADEVSAKSSNAAPKRKPRRPLPNKLAAQTDL